MDSFVPRHAEIAIPDQGGEVLARVEFNPDETKWQWACADPNLERQLNHYLTLDYWFTEYAPDKFAAMVQAVAREFKARITVEPETDFSQFAPDRLY